jgi:FkbM family methyltransferase
MFYELLNIERHIKLYGPWRGLSAYFRPRFNREGLIEIQPFGPQHPIYLRHDSSDLSVFQQVFIDGDYGLRSFPQWNSVLKRAEEIAADGKRPVILDGGANIGLAAIHFAREFPNAVVVAVEPEESNFALLQRNIEPYSNIIPVKAALLDRETKVAIANPDVESWAFRITESDDSGSKEFGNVDARTVDSICSCVSNGELLIAKIDIEGAEHSLFTSGTDWVSRTGVMIVELHDWMLPWEGSSSTFLGTLADGHFDIVNQGENTVAFNRPVLRGCVGQSYR